MIALSNIRVLVADDHGLIRQGISNVLSHHPEIEIVAEASDGPSLFSALTKVKPDCLLIDITMPNFEPISAVETIREKYPKTKILIVSAYDDNVYVKGLFAAGANGYHLKSQPLHELKLAIDQVMSNEKWISSPLVNKLISQPNKSKSLPILTTRQRDLLHLLHMGMDNKRIAKHLNISVKTVENNLTRLYRCLDVQSRLEAVNFAIQNPEALSSTAPPGSLDGLVSGKNEHGTLSLLLVDDNANFRRELRQTINDNIAFPQTMVYEAENISEALELTDRICPKLTLVDMLLGTENGIDATKQLKKQSPNTKIILISAYPDREFHRLGMEAGAIAFLDKKDLDLSALRQILVDNLTF